MAKKNQLRETAAEYHTKSLAEVFWLAFKELDDDSKYSFVSQLLDDPDIYEEIADAVAVIEARGQPTRSLAEIEEELKREGQK